MQITEAELEIMEALWSNAPASARDVYKRLVEKKDWRDKTVKTLLSRLVSKGAVEYSVQDRTYIYSPVIGRHQYQLQESRSIVNKLFGGKVASLFAGFAGSGDLNREEVDEIKALIKQWERENDE